MRHFNRLLIRCTQMQQLLLLQRGRATRTLISRLYHQNYQRGSPLPSSNVQTHLLPSLSPNDCYLFLHEPPSTTEEDETPTPDNCPDRLYSLAAAVDTDGNKKNMDEDHQMLNIIKNRNRLHVDLANSRCIGSSRGWLLFVNCTTLALHLLSPFHANPPIIPLPAIESLPFVLRSMTRNPSRPLGGAYSSHGCFYSSTGFLLSDEFNPVSSMEMMIPEYGKGGVKKFAISSDPLGSGNNNCGCIIMILCNNNRLAFWRLGDKDKVWTALRCSRTKRQRHELMYSSKEKLFYAICQCGVEAWDLHSDPSSPKMHFLSWGTPRFMDPFCWGATRPRGKYNTNDIFFALDSHLGKLLMLVWYEVGDGVGFDVFELDLDFERNKRTHTLLPVNDLGDRALLLDHNQATFVSTSQFPNILKPNSIYLIRDGIKFTFFPGLREVYNYDDEDYNMKLANAGLTFSLGDRSVVAPLFPSITNKIPPNGASWIISPAAIL